MSYTVQLTETPGTRHPTQFWNQMERIKETSGTRYPAQINSGKDLEPDVLDSNLRGTSGTRCPTQ